MRAEALDDRSADPLGAARDGSRELFEQVRLRIADSLYFWTKAILAYPDLTRRCHLPLCLFLQDESRRYKVTELPRRHLKSTIVTISYPLWRFARAAIRGEDLAERIAIASSTKANARILMRPAKMQVESNTLLHTFVPEMLPEFGNDQVWNQDELIFPRQIKRGEPSIDTVGAGSKTTSRHYDGIIEDDMINEENWDSENAVKKAIELHRLGENLLEDPARSWRITNENSWNEFDLNAWIIGNEPETAVLSVGATNGLNRDRSRHLPPVVEQLAAAWDGADTLWPERFGRSALAGILQRVGARIYNAQYENQPFDPDVVDFREEWLGRYTWGRDPVRGRYLRVWPRNGGPVEVVWLSQLYVVGAFDPALSEKTSADRSANVVVGVDDKERAFVLAVDAVRKDPLDVLKLVVQRVAEWCVSLHAVETVLFQKVLYKLLRRECAVWNDDPANRGKPVSFGVFREVSPLRGRDKDGRIRYYLSVPGKDGRIFVHDTMTELVNEWVRFPLGTTKDILDALAYTVQFWRRGLSPEEVAQEEARPLSALEDYDPRGRDPVTGY